MNERKWLPVVPVAHSMSELFAGEEGTVDRSPVSINVALANMHADIIGEDRAEAHERRRMEPRQSVLRTIKERRDEMERQRDRLLDALVFHQLTWAHLADDCAVCDRSVSF